MVSGNFKHEQKILPKWSRLLETLCGSLNLLPITILNIKQLPNFFKSSYKIFEPSQP